MSSTTVTSTTATLCENCNLRPKYFDGVTTHPYCNKTCANKAKPSPSRQATTSANNCDHCKVRPRYRDPTGFTHPYCGKSCAASHAKSSHKKSTGSTSTKATCQAPGCQKAPYTNPDGSLSDYCSQAHRTIGETICLMCHQAPKRPKSHFCSQACIDDAESTSPVLLEVPKGHVTFKSVEEQFKTSWRHTGKRCPHVRRVYKIISPQANLASYNAYRAAVEARGQFVATGRAPGNENRRWHGTRRECNIGDKGRTTLCTSSNCPMCCIIRTSFDLTKFGSKTGWGRFGKGIYTSSTSSKSDDYASNDCSSKLTAILLNKVVVGRGCKMLNDNTTLTAPPPGFDSVLAEKGGSLNHDELVVYRNDAIRPSFLVMYEH
ncbi:putative poly(ADP-ribose) polymerase catalytic domain [Lyophyllum shimeji]|uniref:Poly(ADP-ribose) polymerase catalytic domain n=1 Tax=Lyophyllum shimeji TaxID=47721 RepID=A0A9P3PRI7_LYOSH|nr:putative poly(ADP-ribose) polymerase catalytic domain [Lyophyllum shimeji]